MSDRITEMVASLEARRDATIARIAETVSQHPNLAEQLKHEREVNADLLAALERLLNEQCPNRQFVAGHPGADQARAAILKARGGVDG